jgi:zinc/manganese transport system substrate-binding protein
MTKTMAAFAVVAVVVAAAGVVLVATGGTTGPSPSGRVRVVAAENFYGDITRQIGGDRVQVSSILSDPNADPHLFEPGTRNGLAVADAAVVIQNGAGYDSFMSKLEAAAPSNRRVVVSIADVLGVHGAGVNPHLWYDVPRLPAIAAAIGDALTRADPSHGAEYRRGVARFDRSLAPLRREVAGIRARFRGDPVAYTEPVPGYLLAAARLVVRTPAAFSRAIEDGSEPTPQAVADMQALLSRREVRVLLYNSQTVSPVTARMRAAAQAAGVPVIGVSETQPAGVSFQRWQLDQARALADALAR